MRCQKILSLWHVALVVMTMASVTIATTTPTATATATTTTFRHEAKSLERDVNSNPTSRAFGEAPPEGGVTEDGHYDSMAGGLPAHDDVEDELPSSRTTSTPEGNHAVTATEVHVVLAAPQDQRSLLQEGNARSKDVYHVHNNTERPTTSPSAESFGDSSVKVEVNESSAAEMPAGELCLSNSSVPCEETFGRVVCGTVQDLACWIPKRNTTSSPFALRILNLQDGAFPLALIREMPLWSLDLSDADLRDLHLKDEGEDHIKLPRLEALQLGGNPGFNLGSLRLLQGNQIKRLDLSRKTVGKLAKGLDVVQVFPDLEVLRLDQNELISLPAEFLPKKLEELHVQKNSLIQLELTEELAYSLQVLNASHSYIRSFNLVPRERRSTGTFRQSSGSRRGQPRLRSLDLSNNELPFLSREVVRLLANININSLRLGNNAWDPHQCSLFHLYTWMKKVGAEDVPKFDSKSLRKCGWDECPTKCSCNSDTSTVDCRAQDLLEVPEIGPSGARTLLLDDNNLKHLKGIESRVWCKIKRISANNNRLNVLIPSEVTGQCRCPGEGFDSEGDNCFPPRLNDISVAGNSIKSFSKSDANFISHTRHLNIASNALKTVAQNKNSLSFKYLALIHLDASDNHIKTIDGDDLRYYPYLMFLNLSRNFLNTFPKLPYPFSQTLEVLDVSHNTIFNVPDYENNKSPVFDQNQPNLVELYLDNNRLSNLSNLISIAFKSLRTLGLSKNPWTCTCTQLNAFREMIESRELAQDSALLKALADMDCPDGKYQSKTVRLILDETERLGTCRKTWRMEELTLLLIVALILVFIFSVITLHCPRLSRLCKKTSQERPVETLPDTMFIAYHWKDDWVWKTLIPSMETMGHQIEYIHHMVKPNYAIGQWTRKISQCNKMLVILTDDFLEDSSYLALLREGYKMQMQHAEFKVLLVMRNIEILQRLPFYVHQSLGLIGLNENSLNVETILMLLGAPRQQLDAISETSSVLSETVTWFLCEEKRQDFLRIIQNGLDSGDPSLPPLGSVFSYFNTFHHTSHSSRPQLTIQSFHSQDEWGVIGVGAGNATRGLLFQNEWPSMMPDNNVPALPTSSSHWTTFLSTPTTSTTYLAASTATAPPIELQTNPLVSTEEQASQLTTMEVHSTRM